MSQDRAPACAVLASYGDLEHGWDGEESRAPNTVDLAYAQALLMLLPESLPTPSPMLNSGGRVGFFWNTPDVYADIEIEPEGQFSMLLMVDRSKPVAPTTWHDEVRLNEVDGAWFAEHLAPLIPPRPQEDTENG